MFEGKKSRFVRPEVDRLEISQGDWLEVRRWLNLGEYHQVLEALQSRPHLLVVAEAFQVGIVVAYLVDWSLVGDDGNRVVIRDQAREVVMAAVNALDPLDFKEILKAIQAHETRVTAGLRPNQSQGS